MHFLFFFMDGVGLGKDSASLNPFAAAKMPTLTELLGGGRLVKENAPFTNGYASLAALDACLGVEGLPQSATGQAVLLTGINVPAMIGEHYGPKPNPAIANILKTGNLFTWMRHNGRQAALLNAYPEGYFQAIQSGRRMYSAIPLAVTSAGIDLMNSQDLFSRRALSADFTGQGWRDRLGYTDVPVFTPYEAGARMAHLAQQLDFAFFEYWLSDYVGHSQDLAEAVQILETFDGVLKGLIHNWNSNEGLIFITSDHGNLEDIETRKHTTNSVPGLVIGSLELREKFLEGMKDITDVAPAIRRMFL